MAGSREQDQGRPRRRRARRAITLLVCATVLAVVAAACVPAPDTRPADGSVTVQMDPTRAEGFFSLPWPNEIRKKADGTLDLFGLPMQDNLLLAGLTAAASDELRDFGTNSAIYLRFTDEIDPASLPGPSASALASSPIQVVALDGSGERVPVVARVEPTDGFRPDHLVSLLPYPGHALRPATPYTVLVTTGLRDAHGAALTPAPILDRLDEPFRPGWARSAEDWATLRGQRDDARALLADTGTWSPDDLVGVTAFRTQDSTALMRAVDAAVDAFDIRVPELSPVTDCDQPGGRRYFAGELTVPRFQVGSTARTAQGGRIEIGADRRAVVQELDTIGVGVNVPCAPTPDGGWAVQTYIDGTGADVRPAGGFGREATATVIGSIAPMYSPSENGEFFSDLLFYNFLNPAAAATNPIQQAADNRVLIRMLQALTLDGALVGSPDPVTTDDATVIVTGHSQGAQTVAMVAMGMPEVRAIVTSASTSGRYNGVSYRTDVRDIVALILGTRVRLDVRNPFVQVIETLLDAGEPANFPTEGHWLNFAGRTDGCLPLESARHLAAAQRLTIVDPQWPSLFGDAALDPVVGAAPISGNAADGSTRVSIEADGGHRVAFANTALAGAFIDQVAAGATPTIPDGPFGTSTGPDGCSPRFGEIGNLD